MDVRNDVLSLVTTTKNLKQLRDEFPDRLMNVASHYYYEMGIAHMIKCTSLAQPTDDACWMAADIHRLFNESPVAKLLWTHTGSRHGVFIHKVVSILNRCISKTEDLIHRAHTTAGHNNAFSGLQSKPSTDATHHAPETAPETAPGTEPGYVHTATHAARTVTKTKTWARSSVPLFTDQDDLTFCPNMPVYVCVKSIPVLYRTMDVFRCIKDVLERESLQTKSARVRLSTMQRQSCR